MASAVAADEKRMDDAPPTSVRTRCATSAAGAAMCAAPSAVTRTHLRTRIAGLLLVLTLAAFLLACARADAAPDNPAGVAAAGEQVAGLTLTTTQAPSPLPDRLPRAHPYRPPAGKILQGVASKPIGAYTSAVGKHPAVYQEFVAWGQWLPGITADARANRSRLMMMVTTAYGSRNVITPLGIARGAGDAWLIGLAQAIYASHNITYLRLMAEMNNCENPYAAYNCDGSSRGAQYSSAAFRQAWRRVALIMRGGEVTLINRRLEALHMPPLRTSLAYLPTPAVAMVWVPMVAGNPDLPALAPAAYFPGRAWVDWVGTDFYSRYPNWSGLDRFYAAYAHVAPFAFGEYAIWDGDAPGWAKELFAWISKHPDARMLVYNDASSAFYLSQFPASAAIIRAALAAPKFLAYAPEWAPGSAARRSRRAVAGG
ncbi:hypothetical protein [Conexibacter sp. S30A1]|uniref:hypothetical protein n=1 Tax=Conexibacter sp. S30A1 TaxID=2937800 RepID=UPI00200FD883|nr:hypothetical protein [Conexibacter sp. S30A1]